MWLLVVYAILHSTYCSVDIIENDISRVCVFLEGETKTINAFNTFFSSNMIKPFGSFSYCIHNRDNNALEAIAECGCFSNYTQEIIVYTDDTESELASLIGSENYCSKIPANTITRLQFESDSNYFIYSKSRKICYIGENLLGIGCDSTQQNTFLDVGRVVYSIFDIPEITVNGFLIYTEDRDSYYCMRKDSNPTHTITWYASEASNPPGDEINRVRSWSTFWKKLSNAFSFCAKVLEVLLQSGIIRRV
uniref:VP7 n=1 Tax=Crocidura shantungensis seadorna-like virus 2 TaxID=3139546 RepID=A0AB38ZK46_9REOV